MNDRKGSLEELADLYMKETGVPIEFKLFSPPDIYSQKVIAAARAGRLPDVFGILGEKKTLASFIRAGYILDLSGYMAQDKEIWKKSFYPQALEVVSFGKNNIYGVKPGVWGVPIDITVMEFLYNKDLFEKAGLDPEKAPATFDEFIDYAKKIKKVCGVDGFVCGWGEGWLLNALATEWAINTMGEKKFLATINGEVSYTDPQWIEVFSFFKKIKDSGILASDITTMINKEAEDSFSKAKAGFSFNGSWSINVYKQLSPGLNYTFFPLPKVSSAYPVKIWGGAGSSFMVNTNSPVKEKAVAFLKWLTEKGQQEFLAKETNNLPSTKNCQKGLSELLTGLAKDLNILTHPNVWPYNEDSRVLEVMNKGLQQVVMGIKTPEEIAKEIQDVKERVLKR
jgi:ABC-type glycerol-3-phosphate transport system substrate-binding protein